MKGGEIANGHLENFNKCFQAKVPKGQSHHEQLRTVRCSKRKIAEQNELEECISLSFHVEARELKLTFCTIVIYNHLIC